MPDSFEISDMEYSEVSFVTAGASQLADIVLSKSADHAPCEIVSADAMALNLKLAIAKL
jgi:hypothetical protein